MFLCASALKPRRAPNRRSNLHLQAFFLIPFFSTKSSRLIYTFYNSCRLARWRCGLGSDDGPGIDVCPIDHANPQLLNSRHRRAGSQCKSIDVERRNTRLLSLSACCRRTIDGVWGIGTRGRLAQGKSQGRYEMDGQGN